MRRAATALAIVAALLVAGCGDDDAARERPEMPASATTRDPAAGEFPSKPQVADDFEDPGSGWPVDGYREGVYVLGSGQTSAVLAPRAVEPATRGTLAEVVLEPAKGGAGLLCRASADGAPGQPVTLIYSVNATPYAHVVDRESVDPGRSARLGLVARDGDARFDDFALFLAEG